MSTSATEPSDSQAVPVPSTPRLALLLELQEVDLALDRLAYKRRELADGSRSPSLVHGSLS